ncbi:MAG: PaaX family transcriptional regulator C-terminal domain-containing protein [Dehalococcoidia bacterium]|jgi:phenylacetic acid degradation operon negative regulatory protein
MFSPRAAILTLYGDYLLTRGGEIWIASLIEVLGNFGLSQQAVRSAVSRMCRGGLLQAKHVGGKSYYSLTKSGYDLLTEGAQRIFQRRKAGWDGNWNIVVYSIPETMRQARDRLRLELRWMGYGPLSEATWLSPYDLTAEVKNLLKRLNVEEYVNIFNAQYKSGADSKNIVARCWDLKKIHQQYVDFLEAYRPKLAEHQKRLKAGETIAPSEYFVARFNLIHEYRKLPFFDPDLPLELLPGNWLRPDAAALFDEYHASLTEKADEYFDSVSPESPEGTSEIEKDGPQALTKNLVEAGFHLPVSPRHSINTER